MRNKDSAGWKTVWYSLLRNGSLGVILALCFFTVSLVAVRAGGGSEVMTNIEADLSGAAINGLVPSADAAVKTFADGNSDFEVKVTNINMSDGTVLLVSVDGVQVGTIQLAGMLGELQLSTVNGQTVPQINSRTRIVVSDQVNNTIVAGAFSNIPPPGASPSPTPIPDPNGEMRLESRLAGATIDGLLPKGDAKFRSYVDGMKTRFDIDIQVEKLNLPVGSVLDVLVDNVNVGQITTSSTLDSELKLESEKGAIVPGVTTASSVVVTDEKGRTILSGVFNTAAAAIPGNDIDDTHYFVEQHYRDFFDREADDSGLDFWEHQINDCGDDSACREGARINTSGAFFLSIEFQETGYLLYRFNKSSFGTMPPRNDFIVEMQAIGQGVVVGQPGWEKKLEENKREAAERWATRDDFRARYDGQSNSDFVDELFKHAGVTPGKAERQDLISGLDSATETRGSAMRKISENAEFTLNEKNPAFVLMEYFGYLHRNPNEGPDHDWSGFNFWLQKLNDNGGDFHKADMVKAFLVAGEYRDRFQW